MESATLPSLRVDPALREAAEGVLLEGESLSSFVEQSVRAQVERRLAQREFIARGLNSRDASRRTGAYVPSDAEADLVRLYDFLLAQADGDWTC